MAHALDLARINRTLLQELAKAVGELDLSGPIALRHGQRGKNVRRQDVAADDGEIGRRVLAPWFFHQILDLVDAVPERLGHRRDHPVARHILHRDALDRQNGAAHPLEGIDHLLDCGRLGIDHVIAQQDGKRLVADEFARDQNGVSQAERFALADVRDIDHARDLSDLVQLLTLAARFQKRFELDRDIEVILNRVLPATGDEDDVVDA